MKKLLPTIFILHFAANLLAQSYVMPKLGITYSNVALNSRTQSLFQFGAGLYDLEYKLGFTGGVAINRELNDNLSVQMEFLLTEKGFQGKADFFGDRLLLRSRLYYFEVPLLAKYSFGTDDIQFYLNAGPSIAYALGGRFKGYDTTATIAFTETPKPNEYFFNNRLDLGLQAGLGLAFDTGNGKWIVDARFGYGLSHLLNPPRGVNQSDFKNQNRVFALTLGYMLPLDGGKSKKRYKRRR
ncbi:MAG: PorT family protein [Microscillaceae bacterium]|jgi:hypothetical protein|nr:PorT family protein [Microscillaceae bacterium]